MFFTWISSNLPSKHVSFTPNKPIKEEVEERQEWKLFIASRLQDRVIMVQF